MLVHRRIMPERQHAAKHLPRALRTLANEARGTLLGPHPSPELEPKAARLSRRHTRRPCHLRAIPSTTPSVRHGHSRPSGLRRLYYRCAAARMVRMGSPVRFRRGLHIASDQRKCWPSSRSGLVRLDGEHVHVRMRSLHRSSVGNVDSSHQGHCPLLSLLHLGHSAVQRFENAYLAPNKGSYVRAAIDRRGF
jgi:hypothetical protein